MARDIGCTVAELMFRLSFTELMEWADYYAWEAQQAEQAAAKAMEQARLEAHRR